MDMKLISNFAIQKKIDIVLEEKWGKYLDLIGL
jgi:hypothetical protein